MSELPAFLRHVATSARHSNRCEKCGRFTNYYDLIEQADYWPFGLWLCPRCNTFAAEWRLTQPAG